MAQPSFSEIPEALVKFTRNTLKELSEEQYNTYEEYIYQYKEILKKKEFAKKAGFSDKNLTFVKKSGALYSRQEHTLRRFSKMVFAPLNIFISPFKKLMSSSFGSKISPKLHAKYKRFEGYAEIEKNFKAFEGLTESIKIWENGYRKELNLPKWSENDEFLIPKDILMDKITRRRLKSVDPNKAKYSSTNYMLGTRMVSGTIAGVYLANDAYNTTMRFSNNKQESDSQRESRFLQEVSRVTLNMYLQNILFGTFERFVNSNLVNALFVSGATVTASEILGRNLVGKPILPSNKETLDKKEKEMASKKGFFAAIGRMLTRVKKPENKENLNKKSDTINSNSNTFKGVSFKGNFYQIQKTFTQREFKSFLNLIKAADKNEYERYSKIIKNEFNFLKTHENKNIANFDTVEDAIAQLQTVPLGQKETVHGKIFKSVVFYGFFKGIGDGVKNIFNKLTKKKLSPSELFDIALKKTNMTKESLVDNFNQYKKQRLELPAWKRSPLSDKDKDEKLLKEFLEALTKRNEEIEGVKNLILDLDKKIKLKDIDPERLTLEDINKTKNIIMKNTITADSSKHVEYDGNMLAQLNVNIARILTTLFLVTDAYNLTMQYSNDNKKDALLSAKNRTIQEISRITVSAYILAFVHNLLSKVNNASLWGAWLLVAITSNINDSLSRKVVGVPVGIKSYDELKNSDKKMQVSKNPLKRALAYSLGKNVQPTNKSVEIKKNEQKNVSLVDKFIMQLNQ